MKLHATALLLAAAVGAAGAQDDSQRAQVEQRVRLTARLIADSPTAQRIRSSGDSVAISHFDEGRLHQSLAEERLARGDFAGARRAVEDALMHIGMARRMVPDARARQAAARQRYEQLFPSVSRLLEAWRQRGPSTADPDLMQAESQTAAAQQAQQDGRYEDANQILAAAEQRVLAGIKRLLHAGTLDYTERAATPAEELRVAMARHQSLAELIPIALADLRPPAAAVALIERYQETSRSLRAQATQSAQRGDTEQALEHIRSASAVARLVMEKSRVDTVADGFSLDLLVSVESSRPNFSKERRL